MPTIYSQTGNALATVSYQGTSAPFGGTLTLPLTDPFTGNQTMVTVPLGAYAYLNIPVGTGSTWITHQITSATLTSQTAQPAYYYAHNFPQAFDVQHELAHHRTRGMGRSPAIIHAGRRAVRRSIDLYLRMRPEEELRQFIAGREIIVQGARFRYSLRKTYSIMEHTMSPMGGHIPYRLHMLEPGFVCEPGAEPRRIASGCVYLDRTPVLDQVLAFIMHVTDPDGEREIIRRTNWTPRLPARVLQMLEMSPIDANPLLRELIEVSEDLGIAA